jgi:small nuclear ribonucleoprotein G
VLRGFDPFMNIVLDEAIENVSTSEKHNIGMVVGTLCLPIPLFHSV